MDSCGPGSNGKPCECEPCEVNKLQADLISSLKREATLSRDLGRMKAENVELNSKLVSVKESLQKAKSSTRVALVDMAEQNAKLVAAYVEKKREVKQLQVMTNQCQGMQLAWALLETPLMSLISCVSCA